MNTMTKYSHEYWNKGKLVSREAPLRVRDIWARLQLAQRARDLARAIVMQQKLQCDLNALSKHE